MEPETKPEQPLSPEPSATLGAMTEAQQEKTIRRLFYRLAGCFGAQWQNQFVGDATMAQVIKAEWRQRLRNTPPERIAKGLERLETRPPASRRFVPGAIEFADLCKPTCHELGIPSKWAAYDDAMAGRYSHPMVATVAAGLGLQWLASSPSKQTRRAWADEYDSAIERACNGETFDWPAGIGDPSLAVTHEQPEPAPLHVARQHMDQLKSRMASDGDA